MGAKDALGVLKGTYREWSEDRASTWAASVAYYTIFGMVPLLVLAIYVVGLFFGEEAARGEIAGQITSVVGPSAAEFIQQTIANASGPQASGTALATLSSVVMLLFSASVVFSQLQKALNHMWDVRAAPEGGMMSFVRKRLLSFGMVMGVAFLLLVSLVLSTALAFLGGHMSDVLPGGEWIWQIVNIVVNIGIITLVFAAIYKVVPDVDIAWSEVWKGALATAVLFVLGKFALGWYLGQKSFSSTYGAAGSALALLVWIYYSTQLFFFGAELTQVLARREGKAIEPDEHAVTEAEYEEKYAYHPGRAHPA